MVSTLINGKETFRLVDTFGFPLELVNDVIREHGMGFNVVEFIEAALASKNYTYDRIKARLLSAMREKNKQGFIDELDKVAKDKGWIPKEEGE